MDAEFDFKDQQPFPYFPYASNQLSYFNSSPFGKFNYYPRSPAYFMNNTANSYRQKKSLGSHNGNALHQNNQSIQNPYQNGSNISQFIHKDNKFDDPNKAISNFENCIQEDQDRPMNENNFGYQLQNYTPYNKKSFSEFNNDYSYHEIQNKNIILNNNNNSSYNNASNSSNNNNNYNIYNHNSNFMQSMSSNNNNKLQNSIPDKITKNEINFISNQQPQKTTRGRGRPKKNSQLPQTVKKIKARGCIIKKRKQIVSSSSDIEDEIQEEYLKEVQEDSSDLKNSEKYKSSIDSMKAEEESLVSSYQSKSKSKTKQNQQYQITTRKSSKTNKNEQQLTKITKNENKEKSSKRLDSREREFNRDGSQSKLQNIQQISNMIIQGGKQFGSPGSVKQIKEKFIQQRNKQMFPNLAEDNINFFPLLLRPNQLQQKYQNKKKFIKRENKNMNQQIVSSSEITYLNESNQNQKNTSKKLSEQNNKLKQNSKSNSHENNIQQKLSEQQNQDQEQKQQHKSDIQQEKSENEGLQEKTTNSHSSSTQNEARDISLDRKESPKQQNFDPQLDNISQNDELANRSTTLNSIIQSSSLKNLNKKYLHSTKISQKMNRYSNINKKGAKNSQIVLKKKLIKKYNNRNQFKQNQQHLNSQKMPLNGFPFNANFQFLINQIRTLNQNSKLQPINFGEQEEYEKKYENEINIIEKQSFLYLSIGKQLQQLASVLKQKYHNYFFQRQISMSQKLVREERGISHKPQSINNNKNFVHPNNFYQILPSHLINGSFVKQE